MTKGLNWNGENVLTAVVKNLAAALGEIGLRAETHSKQELEKGHGVVTGTLRRSIHTAEPGYSWRGDDVEPSESGPEMGGQKAQAAMTDKGLIVQLGSGLRYALLVHQGHQSFEGYHYLTNGVEKTRPEVPEVLAKHKLKRKK